MTDSSAHDASRTDEPATTKTESSYGRRGRAVKLLAVGAALAVALWLARNWLAEVPVSWARQALDARQDDDAARFLEYANWIGPRHAEAEFLRARLARQGGDFPEALEHLRHAEAWGWPATWIELERWMVEAESGRTRQAAGRLAEISANPHADPALIFGAFVRGCLKSRRSFPHAFGLLGVWSGNFPSDPEPHVLMARLSVEVRDWPRVEQSLQRALAAAPDDSAANLAMGELLVSRQRFAEAREHFQRAAADVRNLPVAATREAACCRRLGRGPEARRLLEWATRSYPEDREARVELALVELLDRQPAAAIPLLERVLEVHPEHPDANQALGQALQATGDAEAAQRHFLAASQAQGQLNRIGDLTWKVIENPDDVETRCEIAVLQLKYGSEPAALDWFESVFDLAPDYEPAVQALVAHFRACPAGRDPHVPLIRQYARRFAPEPAAATSASESSAADLARLTRRAFDEATQRWQAVGPADYELEVQVAGRQAATYRTTVRDGQVAQALRNGLPLTPGRSSGAWSVPGMFTTVRLDLEQIERTAAADPSPDPTARTSINSSAHPSGKTGDKSQAPWQVELRGQFHPQWGYPERVQRLERGAGSTNPEVSWVVVRFEILSPSRKTP